jgi:hypothetical protein
MIAEKESQTPIHGSTPEEKLVERSSAPTVLDLRAAFKDLFADLETIVEAERDSNSPKDRPPQQPD